MGLSFLTPMLLGGAALVVVPLVLHMVMRRKPVRLEFPAVRFLREKAVANRRRLRLNHLLLLLVRMAALALMALALARPVVRGAGWLGDREGPVAAVFVFDTAPRMLLREGNRSRLEQAAAMARVLVGKLPATSRIGVIDTAGGPAAFSPTLAAAAARIDRLAAAAPATSLAAAMGEGFRLLEGSDLVRREMYVFTDCSRGAWSAAAPPRGGVAPDTSVLFVDVGAVSPRNYALDTLELSGETIAAGLPLAVSVTTGRAGPDSSRAVAVEMLAADGHYARRAIKPVAWKQAGVGQVEFEITGLDPGVRQGRVVIDGSDDLGADDQRYFTVEVGGPTRVLVAAPRPETKTGLFLTQAIAPVALRKTGRARFEPTLIDVARLEDTPWDGFRGIVLVDPPPLPPRTWDLLSQWLAVGRGLVVWLGPRAGDPQRFNSAESRRVLGGGIVRVWRTTGGDNFFAPASLDHPLLAAFRRVGDAVPWQDFPVARHWEFAPGEAAGDGPAARGVAVFRNGLPAILEHRVGQGDVVVVTTPVSQPAGDPDAWNTLATGFEPWPFVMLANETLLHAVASGDDRNVLAGQPAVLHVERRDVPTAFVRTPSGDDVPAAVDQKRGSITVASTQVPGNYQVRSGGEVGGVSKGFSVNLDPAATDFSRLDAAQLAGLLGAGHRLARTEDELVRDVNLDRVGAELFGWLILVVALLMAGDWIVANRFYAPRARGPSAAAGGRGMIATAAVEDFAVHFDPVGSWSVVAVVAGLLVAVLFAVGPDRSRVSGGRLTALVLLRLGAFLAVVACMLRPELVATKKARQPATVLLLADASESMSVADGPNGRTRWQELTEAVAAARPAAVALERD
ncbi:MAG: hypothetical protein EBZ59_09225, partial [Planctomycetia bacterium]|nr:hypothetical protein [Planctomycetia bacterium]